jgi:hypothetical protein
MPANNNHVFYCPSMEANGGMKPGWYGFIYESDTTVSVPNRRGFDGWMQQGRIANISYDYRNSLTETFSGDLKAVTPYNKLIQVANMALAADVISYGAGRYAHSLRYQFVRGDDSVDTYVDRANPTLWATYAMSPSGNNPYASGNNDVMFLALDHPTDYKTYLK